MSKHHISKAVNANIVKYWILKISYKVKVFFSDDAKGDMSVFPMDL